MEKLHWPRRLSRRRIMNLFIVICICFPFITLSTNYGIRENMDITQKSITKVRVKRNADQTFKNISSLVDVPTNFNFSHFHSRVNFTILWYNPAEWIIRRNKHFKMESCEYNNCRVTENKAFLKDSSAVIFGISMSNMGTFPPVSQKYRNPDQVWVHYSLEAPIYHIFQTEYKTPAWHNTFNWSMNFNIDADVFAPYGTFKPKQTIPRRDYNKIYEMKTKMAVWVVSNCDSQSRRNDYVHALQAAGLQVDIYGSCGPYGRYQGEIEKLTREYKFYLSFENSFCKYYVTEKVLERFNDDAVSVIRGGANYSQLLPSGTYVDVARFQSATQLVKYLQELGSNKKRYTEILHEKDKYMALNEDDFGYPYAMCDLCRKLNTFGGQRKMYTDLFKEVQNEGRCINPNDIKIQK